MRLTEVERDIMKRIKVELGDMAGPVTKALLDRLAAEPEPPANTVPVETWCAAWNEPCGRSRYMAFGTHWMDEGLHRVEDYIGTERLPPDWVPLHTVTIHVPIAAPPEGQDLGAVNVESE